MKTPVREKRLITVTLRKEKPHTEEEEEEEVGATGRSDGRKRCNVNTIMCGNAAVTAATLFLSTQKY